MNQPKIIIAGVEAKIPDIVRDVLEPRRNLVTIDIPYSQGNWIATAMEFSRSEPVDALVLPRWHIEHDYGMQPWESRVVVDVVRNLNLIVPPAEPPTFQATEREYVDYFTSTLTVGMGFRTLLFPINVVFMRLVADGSLLTFGGKSPDAKVAGFKRALRATYGKDL